MKFKFHLFMAFLLTLYCGVSPLKAQERNLIDEAVDSIRKYNYICYYGTDGWGNVPKCWSYTQLLSRHASDKTLDSLSRKHPSPVIRAVAGMSLIERKSDLAVPLVFDLLHDKNMFEIGYADVFMHDNVGNFLLEELFRNSLISERDSLRLIDSLLFSENLRHIERRAKLLKTLPIEEKYYWGVKRMYLEEHDGNALVALARFHREEDTVYVLENLRKYTLSNDDWIYYWYTTLKETAANYHYQHYNLTDCALLAVAEWPHEQFKALLTKIRDSELYPEIRYDMARLRYFFSALMAYRSPWARDMIEETFEMVKKHPGNPPEDFYHGEGRYSLWYGQCFDRAYELNPDHYFDDLHEKYGRENHMGW